jgi:DNA-directed RNA polymerase specialized sigma24 family protein
VRHARIGGKPVADVTDVDAEVEHVWEDVWEKELLNKAFDRVRARYKDNVTFQAFRRVLVDGQTVDEAAASLGCSKETVYKAKQRVAAAMREELEFLRGDVG